MKSAARGPRRAIRSSGIVCTASEALSAVSDGATVAVSGFNLANTPEHLIIELFRRYQETGHPAGLFFIADALPAIPGRAMDVVARELCEARDRKFMRGISLPFLGFSPWLQRLVKEDLAEGYSWPMGVAAYWFREVASGRPGVISKIGIDTAIDPKKDGGALNPSAAKNRTCSVRSIDFDGQEYLLYEAPKPSVGLVRGTRADRRSNISMEQEVMRGTVLSIAQATKAHPSPGVVIAQVKGTTGGAAPPRAVEIPGPLVDYVVVAPGGRHWQVGSAAFNPAFGSRRDESGGAKERVEPAQLVIARRVLMELVGDALSKGSPLVVNLGIGIPALISRLAAQERVSDYIVTVLESGQWGGMALPGVDFGAAIGPFAISTMPDMFSNFEGGTIDAASLGFLQVGKNGDVNPSMLPERLYGPGGFPVIAGGSPRIYFAGAFTAGDSDVGVDHGRLKITRDGEVRKFVDSVYKNFFSGRQALKFGKEVLYVTERAVFRLTSRGLTLEEVAPGADIDRDVLGKMEFRPMIAGDVKTMDVALFSGRPMRLWKKLGSA